MVTEEHLRGVIEQAVISHGWMLKDIKMRFNNLGNPGNYSNELVHAIKVQELLESVMEISEGSE